MSEETYRKICNLYLCMWFENQVTDNEFNELQNTLEKLWSIARTGETK